MRFFIKPFMFILFLALAILSLIASLGVKISARFFGIYFWIMAFGCAMSVIYKCWDSLQVVGILSVAGIVFLILEAELQVRLEDLRDAVRSRF